MISSFVAYNLIKMYNGKMIKIEEKQYLTQEKFEELKTELHRLKMVSRKEIAEKLEFAKSLGDLSENAEYHEARQEQAEIEDRIMTVESILTTAEIIHKTKGDVVMVGSIVTIKIDGDKSPREYQIVGLEESDMSQNKVSNISPVGSALIGKNKGNKVSYITPKGKIECEIIDIK